MCVKDFVTGEYNTYSDSACIHLFRLEKAVDAIFKVQC